jgi:diguanylate cyclase (GGDEF)-like protein
MLDLKRRSSIGIGVYIVLSFLLVFDGGYFYRNRDFSLSFLLLVNGICLIRLIHLFFFHQIETYNAKLNNAVFLSSVIATAMIWGYAFAHSMAQVAEFNAKMLMAICMAGLSSGGVVAFIPERRLSIAFNVIMLFPAGSLMLIKGINFHLAVMIFLFSGYLMMLTLRGAREYWEALENENKLKDKTIELKLLSHTDALTGIYNRRFFNEIFDFEWKRAHRDRALLTIIICDIDYFKLVNDTFGHIAGDEYLRRIAERLRETFKRDTDIVARYGGEEFVVLISGNSIEQVFQMAEDVRCEIEDLCLPWKDDQIRTTMSFGISSCVPDHKTTPNMLITRADHALYQAKELGRNRVEVSI